jgi:hypothetical protein
MLDFLYNDMDLISPSRRADAATTWIKFHYFAELMSPIYGPTSSARRYSILLLGDF